MSSKDWIERAIKKPAKSEREDATSKTSKRAGLAEMLLKMRKQKG
jgi:hypothetical protein